jgi:hypothetical protein
MIYPGKKKVVKARSGMNFEQVDKNAQTKSGVQNALSMGANLAVPGLGTAIDAASGIGNAIAGDGTKAGLQVAGDIVNPMSSINSLIDGNFAEAVPVVGSFMKSQRLKKEQQEAKAMENRVKSREMNISSAQMYEGLGKKNQLYHKGGLFPGATNSPEKNGGKSVVLGGNDHEEGGNPVVDANSGKKVAETEKEELLMSQDHTESIEKQVASFDKSKEESDLIDLGRMVQSIVSKGMIDNSGKYKS